MNKWFYFNTSIWLDFFEGRNEPNMPKGDWTKQLIEKIIKEEDKIIVSDVVRNELIGFGFSRYDIEWMFVPLRSIVIYVYTEKNEAGKAYDLSKKREVPLADALHALLSRNCKSVLVSRDAHFLKLKDIIIAKKPEELI